MASVKKARWQMKEGPGCVAEVLPELLDAFHE
jgi:hypothetical protein